MKTCSKCKIEKDESCFTVHKKEKDGLYSWCKQCCSEKNKQNWIENKDKISERAKAYKDANREKYLERSKKYYEQHKDKYAQTRRETRPPEYQAWVGMKNRCNNPNNKDYHHYGARGISVCQEWCDSFEVFYSDLGPKPTPKHQLDRIDNEKGYSKDNCRWVTGTENKRNTRRATYIEYLGLSAPLRTWCDAIGINYMCVNGRLLRGWDIERAFITPNRKELL